FFFFFSSRRRHTRSKRDWSSDVCSSDLELLLQMLIQVIEGYRNDDVADYLTQDIEHRLVYAQNMASQPTISRFLSHLTNEDIDELQELNRRIVSLIDERSANTELVLDLDSTYFETFGHQEKIGF